MALRYLEASTMHELYKEIEAFEMNQINRTDGKFTVSWVNIQKEDDKYVCIASSTHTIVSGNITVEGKVNTWEQNPIKIINDYDNPLSVSVVR